MTLFVLFTFFFPGIRTITDIFSASERGNAMGLFFLGPLIGPVLGPLAGGYINQCKCA
jgi:MFS family permease